MLPNPVADGFYTGAAAGHGNYYAWSWGDALFVVLDPFTYSADRIRSADENWSRTLGEAQYRWLQQVLSESTAPLKLVFIHNLVGGLDRNGRGGAEAAPFFEWGGRGLDGSEQFAGRRPGWELPIHRLLAKHGVSIVFHGHDHLYARQELDGITYQAVPQPGWVGGRNVAQAAEYGYVSGDILPSSGHLRVAVAPDGATIDYVYAALPGAGGGAAPNASVVRSHSVPAGPRNPTGQ